MKVQVALLAVILALAGGNGAPAVPGNFQDAILPEADNAPEMPIRSPGASEPTNGDDQVNHQTQEEILDDTDNESSESSVSLRTWMKQENIDGSDSASGINIDSTLLSEIESALVKEKLEPLYSSISQLKSILLQLRDRADLDVRNIGESIPGENRYSAYSSTDSYLFSDTGDAVSGFYPVGNDADVGRYLEADNLEIPEDGSQKSPRINRTESDLRSKAIESAMADFPEQDAKQQGRRFKRDLGWGRHGNRFYSRYDGPAVDEASFVSSVVEEDADGGASSLFEKTDLVDDDTNRQLMTLIMKSLQSQKSDEKALEHFVNLASLLTGQEPRFGRNRRNKESLETFLETMPTLEGMRKRTSPTVDESEMEPIIPDPGPFYPVPPNLPPPNNVIHPLLPPEEMLQWQPSPDFDEDNAVLEEQTNGVETNPFHKRLRYLKDVERSIMMEPLQDLAMELAGNHPLYPNEAALRVRRMMQIPPPPPYGRKVVKSLYRKKAFGYPYMDTFDTPYDGYGLTVSRRGAQDNWADYLPFGRIDESDQSQGVDNQLIERLLSAIAKKEIKDSILRNLLSLQDIPPEYRREALMQALVAEIASSAEEEEAEAAEDDSESQDSESATNMHWGSFESNEDGGADEEDAGEPESFLVNDIIPKFDDERLEDTIAGGDWGSSVPGARGSESASSVPDWEGVQEESNPNIPEDIEEEQKKILFHKLAEVLQKASDMKH